MLTKPKEDLGSIMQDTGGVSNLRIKSVTNHIVEHIIVGTKERHMKIGLLPMEVHVLNIIIRNGVNSIIETRIRAICSTKSKKTRERDIVKAVMNSFCHPMNNPSRSIKPIGSIKLTNNLRIPIKLKSHEIKKLDLLKILHQLIDLNGLILQRGEIDGFMRKDGG